VQAEDPSLGKFAFWTQHTIKSGAFSVVRWYEIDPVPATPVVLHSSHVGATDAFAFNGAISPDRANNNGVGTFGNRFVIEFNSSSKFVEPNIFAASGVSGGDANSFLLAGVRARRFVYVRSDPRLDDKCRWGDYSGASPDPTPVSLTRTRGVVWGTNQFGQIRITLPIGNEWRTRIFALEP
jgi:hypothetical protein